MANLPESVPPEGKPDKRTAGRAQITLKVDYKRLNSFFADYTKNISKGGTFIATSKPLEVGTEFRFVLSLPSGKEPLTLSGEVMWVVTDAESTPSRPAGMGIRFEIHEGGGAGKGRNVRGKHDAGGARGAHFEEAFGEASGLRLQTPGEFLAMRSTFQAAVFAVALIGLSSLLLHACANGQIRIPPADAGKTGDGASEAEVDGGCGSGDQECCVVGGTGTCHTGFFCNMGTCKPTNPGDIGKACTMPSDCQSGLCVVLGEDGGVMPPNANACSSPCVTTSQCPVAGWTCVQQGIVVGQGVCECTPVAETCDGKDDNCDGKIDEEPAADMACTAMDPMGMPETCVGGMCECVMSCDGNCTDITSDPANCGKCGNMCNPDGGASQTCVNSKCQCADTICSGKCVDTTSDPANCGGCDMPCTYSCSGSTCGPLLMTTAMAGGLGIVSDGTDVFFFSGDPSFSTMALEFCPVTGCPATGPAMVTGATMVNPAADESFLGGGIANLLVLGGTGLFYPDGANVQRSAQTNPVATNFYAGTAANAQPWAVVTDTTYVYWADAGAFNGLGSIFRCPIGTTCNTPTVLVNLTGMPLPGQDAGTGEAGTPEGGLPEASADTGGADGGTFVGVAPPQLIAVDSKYVYWTDGENPNTFEGGGNINAQLLTGGPPFTILNNTINDGFPTPTALLAYNGIVYWTTGMGGVNACAADAPALCNPTTPPVFGNTPAAVGLATDGTTLYWTNSSPAAVYKCMLGATCTTPTMLVEQSGQVTPGYITVDSKHTFWLDSTSGGVYEFSK